MYNFSASLYCFKNKFELGACMCVSERDRFESSPDAPEGIRWVPIEGDYIQMVLAGRLKFPKDSVKPGQWAGSFPSKALAFLLVSCFVFASLKAECGPPAHSCPAFFFKPENNKKSKVGVQSFHICFETGNQILRMVLRALIFNFSVQRRGMFSGETFFLSSREKNHLLFLTWQGPALWPGHTFASEKILITYLMLHSP